MIPAHEKRIALLLIGLCLWVEMAIVVTSCVRTVRDALLSGVILASLAWVVARLAKA